MGRAIDEIFNDDQRSAAKMGGESDPTGRAILFAKTKRGDEKINNMCTHKETHAHIYENTYFIKFDHL